GERVFHPGWDRRVNPPRYDPIRLQLPQLLRQHLLRDPGQLPAQLRKAPGTLLQPPEDERLPLAAEHIDRGLAGAVVGSVSYGRLGAIVLGSTRLYCAYFSPGRQARRIDAPAWWR